MSGNGDYVWSLSRDGILWKKLAEPILSPHRKQAMRLVQELEASMGPVDLLSGMLLDRIVANCVRQWGLLEVQRQTAPELTIVHGNCISATLIAERVGSSWFANLLKYENLLNQAFHRDVVLLKMLQKAHPVTVKKPPQSDRSIIEGQPDSSAADQAVGSTAAAEPVKRAVEVPEEPSGRSEQDDFTVNLD